MSETGFTAGPWYIGDINLDPNAGAVGETAIMAATSGPLGLCTPAVALPFGGSADGVRVMNANAHLIASAPDLYEALEEGIGLAQAALNTLPVDGDGRVAESRRLMRGLIAEHRAALSKACGA